MGAGAIGCYLGGKLIEAGCAVTLVGRPALAEEIAAHGLSLSDYHGHAARLEPSRLSIGTSASALAASELVLVTVKRGDTARAGAALAPHLPAEAVVVSFQNGVDNPDVLRAALPGRRVLAGMVPFNVLRQDGARFHQGTSGTLAVERDPAGAPLVEALRRAELPVETYPDMRPVLWGKLLVNLNNSVNALSGVPIQQMLAERAYRRVMAACIREGLHALQRAGIRPKLEMPLPPRLIPHLLTLPDAIFSLAARRMITVDPQARSSMWDDLQRGRTTEVDGLNGEVVRLAARVGTAAPVNAGIVDLVRAAEGHGSPGINAPALLARLGL
jgi:2-dehydropantoate 2-reductase